MHSNCCQEGASPTRRRCWAQPRTDEALTEPVAIAVARSWRPGCTRRVQGVQKQISDCWPAGRKVVRAAHPEPKPPQWVRGDRKRFEKWETKPISSAAPSPVDGLGRGDGVGNRAAVFGQVRRHPFPPWMACTDAITSKMAHANWRERLMVAVEDGGRNCGLLRPARLQGRLMILNAPTSLGRAKKASLRARRAAGSLCLSWSIHPRVPSAFLPKVSIEALHADRGLHAERPPKCTLEPLKLNQTCVKAVEARPGAKRRSLPRQRPRSAAAHPSRRPARSSGRPWRRWCTWPR